MEVAPWIESVENVSNRTALVTVRQRSGKRVGYLISRERFTPEDPDPMSQSENQPHE